MAKTIITEKKKVLFFDNETFVVKSLCLSLTSFFNWEVKVVASIDELFYELKQDDVHYDILMLDIMAPLPKTNEEHVTFNEAELVEMEDGLRTSVVLAKKIWKSLPNYKDHPILFLSARSNPIPNDKTLKGHKNCDYLRKPQFAKDIDAKLRELLSK